MQVGKYQYQGIPEAVAEISRAAGRAIALVVILLCGGLLLGGAPCAWAQSTTATLGGRVTDPQGRVVAGAQVVVTSNSTGVQIKTQTNNSGEWRVDSLVPGSYRFRVTAQGFAALDHSAIDLQIADQKFIDVALSVGSTSQSVVVQSTTPLIDTTAAVAGTVLTNNELNELPSETNSPTELAVLAPGVFMAPPQGGAAYLWSNVSESGITVNASGSGTNAVNYTVDGATNTIVSSGDIAYIPPMDSVNEVRVTTNSYDASIGRTAAGTINLALKSGSDQFHGDLYERNQNNFLNADYTQYNASHQPTPTIRFNEFGGTVGGPVWIPKLYSGRKHGTFFFFSYDGIRSIAPSEVGFLSLPTEAERNGDFSQVMEAVNGVSYPVIPYDPLTIDPATGDRQPFPGAIIPSGRISPEAKAILALLPLPNATPTIPNTDTNDFLENSPEHNTFNSYSARVDHAWNNNNHSYVEWRYNSFNQHTQDPFGPSNILVGENLVRHNYGLTINHAWVINPNLVATANINATAFKTTDGPSTVGLDPTKYGFSSDLASIQTAQGLPQIEGALGGLTVGDILGPLYENDYEWEAKGSLIQTIGSHVIHYGGEYLLQQEAAGNLLGGSGIFDFSSTPLTGPLLSYWTTPNPNTTPPPGTGSTNAAFLLGLPASGSMANNATAFWGQPYMAFYVQDDWRVTPRLTLNLGLRWDLQFGLTERHNRYFSRFDPTANIAPVTNYAQPNYAQLVGGPATNSGVALLQKYRSDVSAFQALGAIEYAGVNGTSRSITDLRYRYFQPRFGFAYQFHPHTVLRGGYGRFVQANFVANHANQLGYSSTTPFTATNDNYYTSAATLDNPFPNGLVPTTGNSMGTLTNVGSVTGFTTSKVKRQYTDDASLRLQQQFKDYLFEIAGIWERTTGLDVTYQIDNPSLDAWHAAFDPEFDSTGRPVDTLPGNVQVTNPFKGAPYITTSLDTAKTERAYLFARPNPLVDGLTENFYTGTSTHYALQVKLEHRLRNGFGIETNFTWGKQMDATGYFTPSVVSQKLHRVLSGSDRRFQYVLSPTYTLPFGRGRLIGSHVNRLTDEVIGGWEIVGIYNFYSGTPVGLPTNSSFFEGGDPEQGIQKSAKEWFNTSKFMPFPNRSTTVQQLATYPAWTKVKSLPGYGWVPTSSSDASKNGVYNDFNTWVSDNSETYSTVRNPYENNWSIGLRKSFEIHESMRLQLRIDAFNALNHPQAGGPDTNPSDTYFGWLNGSPVPSQVNTPRQIQLEGKLYF